MFHLNIIEKLNVYTTFQLLKDVFQNIYTTTY